MEPKEITFEPGQILFRQGETGGTLYFIKAGNVELSVRNKEAGTEAPIAEVTFPAVLGTLTFLEDEPRSATAKALTEVKCTVIGPVQRKKMMEKIPTWFRILVKDLSNSLRTTNAHFAALKAEHTTLQSKYQTLLKQIRQLRQDEKAGTAQPDLKKPA